ncbi:hypothetical protein [Mycobacteroides abscessus]|uniref:hypothetical protein n=1 Tax=Mycobacteroides abscessus TaxID=36809 RepID=UPI001F44EDC4|nr:hypothetical protein [Mycobacteroides abscessus]
MEPHDEWQLNKLVAAYELVRDSQLEYEAAKELQGRVRQLRSWVNAEYAWKKGTERWLKAEKQWQAHRELMDNDPAYKAAEQGWLAMRELTVNLDGRPSFDQLSPILQTRYAAFAKAVLDQQEN